MIRLKHPISKTLSIIIHQYFDYSTCIPAADIDFKIGHFDNFQTSDTLTLDRVMLDPKPLKMRRKKI